MFFLHNRGRTLVAQRGHRLKPLVHRLSNPAIGKQRFRNSWYRDLADRRCQDSAILPYPLRTHANCAIGGDAPHQPAPKFRPRIQGDDVKDERIFISSSARPLRAASASSISTLTNLTGVLG